VPGAAGSPAAPTRIEPQRLFARIIGAAPLSGAANRWLYEWQEVNLRDDRSAVVGSAPRGSAALGPALNLMEAGNSASGVQGNGVDVSGLPAGMTLRPIGGAAVVALEGPLGAPGDEYWVFAAVNAIDGECDESPAPGPGVAEGGAGGTTATLLDGADELLALAMMGRAL
ncbi:MAG: hypothetical protein IBJ10_09985, partial [Phycisphaerales bacterium]|nr:hypothetical protein [Phycisphaerales bacterium]